MKERPTCPCRICATPTPMLGTKLCDRCWELERRIDSDPDLAERILQSKRRAHADAALAEAVKWARGKIEELLWRPEDHEQKDMIDLVATHLSTLIAHAARAPERERAAAEAMREAAATAARFACLVPPDGGSPTDDEIAVCEEAERRIRALPLPPAAEREEAP